MCILSLTLREALIHASLARVSGQSASGKRRSRAAFASQVTLPAADGFLSVQANMSPLNQPTRFWLRIWTLSCKFE